MRFELYQRETERLTRQQTALLDQARHILSAQQTLNPLEDAGGTGLPRRLRLLATTKWA